jgi:predicted dinucleotide-binding enzyme/predicted ester cyclase
MNITIVGRGHLGAALATRWTAAGHTVTFAVRDAAGASPVDGAAVGLLGEAERGADVVVLAVPGDVAVEVAGPLAMDPGTVLVDATNGIGENLTHRAPEGFASTAEAVAAAVPGVRVVKAFNHAGAAVAADPAFPAGAVTGFAAGDDPDAKQVVLALAAEAGFDPVDAGPLAVAAQLEHAALLWIGLAYRQGLGDGIALRLVSRVDPLEGAIRDMYDAWNAGRMEDFYDRLSPEVVDRNAAADENGLAGVRAALDTIRAAFPDSRYEVLEVVSNGHDHTAARLQFTGTHLGDFFGEPATGRSASWTETRVCRWRDGKVVEHVANVDVFGMRAQLGLLDPVGRGQW